MSHLVLIDGSGYLFRAFHALPPMLRPCDGTPVNAVFGYTKLITKISEQFDASHMAVIFDAKGATFRNDIYADYKANRPPPPEELVPQFALVREATKAMGLACIEKQGYEADDIIATYARKARGQGMKVTILSTDKDLMQLVEDDHILLYDSFKNRSIGEMGVKEKFGVSPNRVIDVQALAGDSSDNVPGVSGIGIKTAAQLINQYGSLEGLLARAGEIKQPKRREKLITEAELARISYQLVTLDDNVPELEDIEEFKIKSANAEELGAFLAHQGFQSLLMALKQKTGIDISVSENAAKAKTNKAQDDVAKASKEEIEKAALILPKAAKIKKPVYSYVNTEQDLALWLDNITKMRQVAIDTETTSLDTQIAELVGISLSVEEGKACYIPLAHKKQAPMDLLDLGEADGNDIAQLPIKYVLEALQKILEDDSILKIGHNIKYDLHILTRAYKKYELNLQSIAPIADTMVMSFNCNAGLHGHAMDTVSERYLEHTPIAYSEIVGVGRKQISFAEVDIEKATFYAAEDADITLRLYHYFLPRLAANQVTYIYEKFDKPLIAILQDMESHGVKLDQLKLKELSEDFAIKLKELEGEIYQMAEEEFNIASPSQLGEILFGKLGFKGGKKSSKTKQYSTSASVLEKLAEEGHDFPQKILDYRGFAKLRSTYTEALLKQVNIQTARVHTNYLITGAATGRLASNEPNLQNIPVRTSDGRKIRQAFIAEKNHKLISADYSQVELRLLAHVAKEKALIAAFKKNVDIHAMAAHQVFGVPLENMDPMVRRAAKAINFGIVYGISAFGLARQLDISNGEAKEYIDTWFRRYPGVRRYMHNAVEEARFYGYVKTFMGRKVHIPSINEKGAQRGFGERLAINAPIQGGAADIVKKAMINLHEKLKDTDCKMLLQVHDELIFEVPEKKAEKYKKLIIKEMEKAVKISVPLTVEASIGDNWGEIH